MSTDKSWLNWCPIPPEPQHNRHKKLAAFTLVCIVGFSVFACLPQLCGFTAVQTSGFAAVPVTILNVVNAYEGAVYLQNATFQQLTETEKSTLPNLELTMNQNQDDTDALHFGCMDWYTAEDSGSINTNIVNCGNEPLTVTSIEIYCGDKLFVLIDGPFVVDAHSVGAVTFEVCNLMELSKTETQIRAHSKNEKGENNETIFAGHVMYTCVMKTSEGVTASFEKFMFGAGCVSCVPS
jgi:hypothetical protein